MSQSVVWGDGILDAGFSQIPNILLDHQHDLDISNDEMMLVIHVLRYKHSSHDPYPRNATIAERMQCSERTLERYIASLKEKSYLKREQVNDWRYTWDFSLLLNKLRGLSVGGDKSDTPPGVSYVPPPGDKSVTQNNTSIKNNTKSEAPHARTHEEEFQDEEPKTPLDYVEEDNNPVTVVERFYDAIRQPLPALPYLQRDQAACAEFLKHFTPDQIIGAVETRENIRSFKYLSLGMLRDMYAPAAQAQTGIDMVAVTNKRLEQYKKVPKADPEDVKKAIDECKKELNRHKFDSRTVAEPVMEELPF